MTSRAVPIVPPGGVIGILGGGQLGRMTALAAARLGYRCHVFCPEVNTPAGQVAQGATLAAYDDERALAGFASAIDVCTLEFENVPVRALEIVGARVPVRPGPRVLAIAQDRIDEKTFFNGLGMETAPWREVNALDALREAIGALGTPCLLKTARLGYDGKGQIRIDTPDAAETAWRDIGGGRCILEGFVDFRRELSAIVARGEDGAMVAYDPGENVHSGGILRTTAVPGGIAPAVSAEAIAMARRAAEALDVVGLLAVELFETRDGRLLVNEMAPRPHNSGHWTMDAAVTDQFEQLVRAVSGLPLGATDRLADARMENLIGTEVDGWREALADPHARLHLYGKGSARPGRKMGHVTRILGPATARPAAD